MNYAHRIPVTSNRNRRSMNSIGFSKRKGTRLQSNTLRVFKRTCAYILFQDNSWWESGTSNSSAVVRYLGIASIPFVRIGQVPGGPTLQWRLNEVQVTLVQFLSKMQHEFNGRSAFDICDTQLSLRHQQAWIPASARMGLNTERPRNEPFSNYKITCPVSVALSH